MRLSGSGGRYGRWEAERRRAAKAKPRASVTAQSAGVAVSDKGAKPGKAEAGGAEASGANAPGASPKAARRPQRPAVPWSAEREAIFLEALAQTCSVTNAVRASGLSSATIYRRRDASDMFRAAWVQALREAYVRLETELLGRALNGVRKPVWHAGKKVGSVVEYSDRLALALLGQYRETCRGGASLVTLRALAEEASEAGAARVLERLGLSDPAARSDLGEMRQLLGAWRR